MSVIHPAPEELALYVMGALEPEALAHLEAHLPACPACAAALAKEAELEVRLLELAPLVGAALKPPVPITPKAQRTSAIPLVPASLAANQDHAAERAEAPSCSQTAQQSAPLALGHTARRSSAMELPAAPAQSRWWRAGLLAASLLLVFGLSRRPTHRVAPLPQTESSLDEATFAASLPFSAWPVAADPLLCEGTEALALCPAPSDGRPRYSIPGSGGTARPVAFSAGAFAVNDSVDDPAFDPDEESNFTPSIAACFATQ